jgi:RNA polymerase sigma factor (sigma-70 family)
MSGGPRARPDDEALLRRVAAGDQRAFRDLYGRYYRRVFGFVFKLLRQPDLVEEVVDDVLLAVWRGAGRFDGRSRASTWILGIAHRQALKALARRERRSAPPPVMPQAPPPETPESIMARREMAGELGRGLAALSPEQRAVVELTFFHGLSYREVAQVVGCPVNTVKTRMFHARRRLRELLPELAEEAGGGRR